MRSISRLLLQIAPWLSLPALLLFTLWAGQDAPDVVWTSAPGWNGARRVAITADRPAGLQAVPMAIDDSGGVYLITVEADANGQHPQLTALDRNAEVIWRRGFDIPDSELGQLGLVWDGRLLHAFWISGQRLYTASVSPSGEVITAVRALSGDAQVQSYAATTHGRGAVALWYAGPRDAPGLYALPSGDLTGVPQLVDAAGTRPALQADAVGTLHAAWVAQGALWYGAYTGGDLSRGRAAIVAGGSLAGMGDELAGPWFGIDAADAYLIWTTKILTGMNAGSIYTQYLAFPLGAPAQAGEISALSVPAGADLAYTPSVGDLQAGPRVQLGAGGEAGGAPPTDCATGGGISEELVIVCRALVRHRYHDHFDQAGAIFFRGGQPTGYQLVSFGARTAFAPSLAMDSAGQLYMSWLSLGPSGFDVYLASTAPDFGASLSRLGLRDIGRVGFEIIYGMLTGLLFSPFAALLWGIVPIVLVLVTAGLRRERGDLRHWATLLSLGLALGAYWAGKWMLLSDVRAYVPFSAWVPNLPTWLGLPLRVTAPLAIGGLGLWAAWNRTYHRASHSVMLFVLTYMAVDAPLTMAIYGGVFFGAFYPYA